MGPLGIAFRGQSDGSPCCLGVTLVIAFTSWSAESLHNDEVLIGLYGKNNRIVQWVSNRFGEDSMGWIVW